MQWKVRLKTAAKWFGVANPQTPAISLMDSEVFESNWTDSASLSERAKAATEKPVYSRKTWLRWDGDMFTDRAKAVTV